MNATTFINPYNFVPVKNKVDRQVTFNKQEKFQGHSGIMTIRLKALTRLFIPDRRNDESYYWKEPVDVIRRREGRTVTERGEHPHYKKFLENMQGKKIIPGSSLKGMLRSIAETLSNSCFALDTGTYKHHKRSPDGERKTLYYGEKIGEQASSKCILPSPHEPASTGLCICCRIFGYAPVSAKEKSDEEKNSAKGRVMVYDARLEDGSYDKIDKAEYLLWELSEPKVGHSPFYLDDYNAIRGRKFYYHFNAQPEHFTTQSLPEKDRKTHRNCTIHESILRGAVFKFELHFENLSREELALLLYSIRLNGVKNQKDENFMAHKVGMAKPLGFGSVQLVIEKLALFENDAAYLKFDAPDQQTYSDDGEAARTALEAFLKSLAPRENLPDGCANPFSNAGDSYDVWKFSPMRVPEKVHYPNQQWFNDDRRHPGENYPLRKNGVLPDPWQPPGDALDDEQEENTTAPAPSLENVIEVEVLDRKKHDAVVMIENNAHKVFCPRPAIKKGGRIKVIKQPDGTYKWKP